MFNSIKNIINNNNKTFYNYRTKDKKSCRKSMLFKFALALVMTTYSYIIPKDLINLVVTVYAILLGFGFNILFYLISIMDKSLKTGENINVSREDKIINEKNSTLAKEMFYNVSYFNVVALFLICISIVYSGFICDVDLDESLINQFISSLNNYSDYLKVIYVLSYVAISLLSFLFYYLVIESLYTFCRIVCRTGFYFDKIIEKSN